MGGPVSSAILEAEKQEQGKFRVCMSGRELQTSLGNLGRVGLKAESKKRVRAGGIEWRTSPCSAEFGQESKQASNNKPKTNSKQNNQTKPNH